MRDDLAIKHDTNKALWSCACGFITASEEAWFKHCDAWREFQKVDAPTGEK